MRDDAESDKPSNTDSFDNIVFQLSTKTFQNPLALEGEGWGEGEWCS